MAERTKLYEQAQVRVPGAGPGLPAGALARSHAVVRKNVSGYMMDPLGIHRFDGVDKAE